jgi:hypothetical protein
MENKKSISDITISERRESVNINRIEEKRRTKTVSSYKKKNRKIRPIIITVIFFTVIIVFVISFFFHSSKINVRSKSETISFLNDTYKGVFSDTKTDTVVRIKSVGKIKITNSTNERQILREDTRFETLSKGEKNIYKIFDRVTIKKRSSVVVSAYSDSYGERYNLKKGEKLKVPGFKEAKMTEEYRDIVGEISEDFVFSDKITESGNKEDKIKTLGQSNYEIIEVEAKVSNEISSVGVEEVFNKAKGKIKIINNTKKNQKLRKETRFKFKDLVFKTYKSVTIPANSSVVVDAFADEAGRKYNIKKDIDFIVPGFKEAKMNYEYKNIVGLSFTDFSGGMIGKINIPNKNELVAVKEKLKVKSYKILKDKLNKINSGDEYIIINSKLNVIDEFDVKSVGEKVFVNIVSKQKIPVLKKVDFANMILKISEKGKASKIKINDFSKLQFKILDMENFNISKNKDIIFSVTGSAKVS